LRVQGLRSQKDRCVLFWYAKPLGSVWNNLSVVPTCGTQCVPEFVSFDASTGSRTSLEKLKDADILKRIANQLIESIPLAGSYAEHRIRLKEFSGATIGLDPENLMSDVGSLVGLLSQER